MTSTTDPQPSAAPAGLELVRRFVNTRDVEEGTDEIATPGGLKQWLGAQALPAGADPGAGDVARFAAAREGLRALLFVNNGEPLDAAAVARLDAIAADVALHVRFRPAGELEPAAATTDGALGAILATAYAAMKDGTWERLKACRADDCQWAFYDRSRNRSGKWCSMEVCGNRAKARSYRDRHRDRPEPA